ncbi:MAG: hypothetical protein V4723_07130 [Pseudomonadota bacterium]
MNPSKNNERWLDFARYHARRDSKAERTVEISVELQRYQNTAHAAAFLHEHGIKLETALRVLTQPTARRVLPLS